MEIVDLPISDSFDRDRSKKVDWIMQKDRFLSQSSIFSRQLIVWLQPTNIQVNPSPEESVKDGNDCGKVKVRNAGKKR
jgi:hypothetical protein